ncbi:MAG: recombinase family protein, partial [Clostridia bacterium]|nr:recombinase family protein [Clostridia bacterium]
MKGAVIYARYSSERQNEQSIDGQLTVCYKFAEENGLTILNTYIDRAMTGTNDNRAAFQQMLSDAEKPVAWDIVLVYALDRFGRDSIEISVNKYRLRKAGKTLISATQRTSVNIDGTKNLDGILLENVYIGLAEYYSAELSQKIKRGLLENRKKGLCTSGKIPYGYKIVNKKAMINEDEAAVVKYIFNEYYMGKVVPDIITDLTNKGIMYKGKPFYKTILYYILRLEKYIGIARYKDGVYDNIFPPIIDKNIFDTIQIMLAKNKIGSRSTEVDFLLKGKIFCGYCGKNIQGNSGTSQCGKISYYYTCISRKNKKGCNKENIRKSELEKLIIDTTISLMSDSNMLNT